MRENREEKIVAEMFARQGYIVEREPHHNLPPDIVLNGDVAVEVTRLSKVINSKGQPIPIGNDSTSIIQRLKNAINSPDYTSHKYSVHATIKRPFINFDEARKNIKEILRNIETKGRRFSS